MKNIISYIIGGLSVGTLVFIGMFLLLRGETDPRILREKARVASCVTIGHLTDKCYSGDSTACGSLENTEVQHSNDYNKEAYIDCFTKPEKKEMVEKATAHGPDDAIPLYVDPSSDPKNPLFRGDEEGN